MKLLLKSLIIALPLIGGIGCGKLQHKQRVPGQYIAPEFIQHVQLFERLVNRNIASSLVFGNTVKPVVATCAYKPGRRLITVDINWWHSTTSICRESVIMHELGHCELNRGHTNTRHSGVMVSVMNASVNCSDYSNYRHEYLNELITKSVDNIVDAIDTN